MKGLKICQIILISVLFSVLLINCGDKSKKLVFDADQARVMNKFEQAEKLYQEAISLNPGYAMAYNNYGILLQIQKKWDEAKSQFQKAAELFIDSKNKAIATNNIGMNYDLQADYEKAKQYYEESIELHPNYYESNHNLGTIYYVTDNYDKAIEVFIKTLHIIQNSDLIYKAKAIQNTSQYLTLAYLKKGDIVNAEKTINGLIQIDPFSEGNYSILGDICIKKENYESANENYQKALSLNPNSINAMAGLALSYAKSEKMDDALRVINDALSLNKDAAVTRLCAGKIFLIKGDKDRAKSELQEGLKIDPDNKEIKELLTTLEAE